MEPSSANELGALDRDAIARVADEAWPLVRDADELHDALLTGGFLTEIEGVSGRGESWAGLFEELVLSRRAVRVCIDQTDATRMFWVAAERLAEFVCMWSGRDAARISVNGSSPHEEVEIGAITTGEAFKQMLQGRMELVGAVTAHALHGSFGLPVSDIEVGLHELEREGVILRGHFTPGSETQEWCDRRLLARVHRYTIQRLRAEIEPVSIADFMRFLFVWQKVHPDHLVAGVDGLASVIDQLDGYEVAGGAWETDVLAQRVTNYEPTLLDTLSLTGRVAWGRISSPTRPGGGPYASGPVRSTPIALFKREHAGIWLALAGPLGENELPTNAQVVLNVLKRRGATFFHELVSESELLATHVEQALGTLVAAGLVSSDSFAGLRALLLPADKRPRLRTRAGRNRVAPPTSIETAGRWAVLARCTDPEMEESATTEQAWTLLRRYGIVFRRLLARESNLAPWRNLTRVYRQLEARGEIRGGRFVAGVSGEQFALPEAVGTMRRVRKGEANGECLGVSGADPLNLTGVLTPGERIAAIAPNRIVFRDGVPVAASESGESRNLAEIESADQPAVDAALRRRGISPALRPYLGKTG